MRKIIALLMLNFLLLSCSLFESLESKQTTACIEDIKLGLNDPNSIELVSFDVINMDNGWRRISVQYTAKNALGGRVRGKDICGFSSKNETKLNSKDFMNENRKLARDLRSLGVDIK